MYKATPTSRSAQPTHLCADGISEACDLAKPDSVVPLNPASFKVARLGWQRVGRDRPIPGR